MRARLRLVAAALALWLAAAVLPPAAHAQAAQAQAAQAQAQADVRAETQRKVLVLVRLPPEHFRPNAEYGAGYGDDLGRRAQRRLAGRIAHDHGLRLVDDWPMPLLGLDCFVMAVPGQRSVDAAVQALSHDPGVVWSEPMHLFRAQGGTAAVATHNDPLYPVQPAARAWRLAALHKAATGRGVVVAVIDSQVDVAHPDLAGQVAVSQDFAPSPAHGAEQHGTGVAGVIAAKADNGIGIAGVAPGAKLLALRACWQQARAGTVCDSVSLAKALHFGIERRAQVINLSLAGPPDLLVGRLIDVALARGITVVAAYDPKLPRGGFPASHGGVISVTDQALAAAPPGVYSAPGRDVPTTQPGGKWTLVDGSSYAAAHVSGLAALLRERGRWRRDPLTLVAAGRDGGAIEACATLLRTPPACDCVCAPAMLASLPR